ncbi:hypothetical protein BJ742DRAFT_838934 [Cladochytrium replicatum]|nr:hypothetical protein BJ742DRAFT_838934 [Cladochytrium replicatum]
MDVDEIPADDASVALFCDITGADPTTAEQYLMMSNGDADAAIALYLESNDSNSSSIPAENYNPVEEVSSRPTQTGIRDPIPPRQQVLIDGDDDDIDFTPPSAPSYHARSRPPLRHNHSPAIGNRARPGSSNSPFSAPNAPPGSRANTLDRLFRFPDAIMFQDSLDNAKKKALKENKWVLVSLYDQSEFACMAMNRDLWNDDSVQELVRAHFVFVYFNTEDQEGLQHLNFYPITNYPYVGIIDPLTGERVKTWNVPLKPAEFSLEVMEFLESKTRAGSQSKSKKGGRQSRDLAALSEEEQLRIALEESMQTSSTGTATEEEDDVMIVDDDNGSTERGRTVLTNEQVFERIEANSRVEPPAGPNVTRVQFRYPDGMKKVRRFNKSDPVQRLFEFVKGENKDAPSTVFELNFNRESLIGKVGMSVEEAGLANASVAVEFQ